VENSRTKFLGEINGGDTRKKVKLKRTKEQNESITQRSGKPPKKRIWGTNPGVREKKKRTKPPDWSTGWGVGS